MKEFDYLKDQVNVVMDAFYHNVKLIIRVMLTSVCWHPAWCWGVHTRQDNLHHQEELKHNEQQERNVLKAQAKISLSVFLLLPFLSLLHILLL